jgi:rhodanese-related sulfurtransferase
MPTSETLTLSDLNNLIESGIPFALIDVREDAEWQTGHLEGAKHIPLGRLLSDPDITDELDRNMAIVIYCQHGIRSQTAVEYLRAAGFNALNLLVNW